MNYLYGIPLHNDNAVWNLAKTIHDRLESMLLKSKTFFSSDVLKFTSFDLVVYAYVKEELINIPESHQVEYLKSSCPKLIDFIQFMDTFMQGDQVLVVESSLKWKQQSECLTIYNSLQQQVNWIDPNSKVDGADQQVSEDVDATGNVV